MDTEILRGGFQNRDVGLSQFGTDYGPDYGIDFADFAAPTPGFENGEGRERLLQDEVLVTFARNTLMRTEGAEHVEVFVKNGFLFLQGPVVTEEDKLNIEKKLGDLPGLHKIINVLSVR
jgi:hypothetical protein